MKPYVLLLALPGLPACALSHSAANDTPPVTPPPAAANQPETTIQKPGTDLPEVDANQPEAQNQDPGIDLFVTPLPPAELARRGTVLFRHENDVTSVAFSPDGKTLASGSADRTIRLWEVSTGKELQKIREHEGYVVSVAFSPDGKRLASLGSERAVRLWDVTTGDELLKFSVRESDAFIGSVAFSPDGKTLVSGDTGMKVRLWEASTGTERLQINEHGWVTAVAFSPDGKTLASASNDHSVRLWGAATGKELLKLEGHTDQVLSIVFSPDVKTLATGSEDKTARLWDVATGKELLRLEGHYGQVVSVAYSPDGKTLASGSRDGIVRLWETATGIELLQIKRQGGAFSPVTFSPDGTRLASGLMSDTIVLWDVLPAPSIVTEDTLKQETLEFLWSDLAGNDAVQAYAATVKLARGGERAVSFLRAHLRTSHPDRYLSKRVLNLIADLDDDDIDVRDKITRELETIGPEAEPVLLRALDQERSYDAVARINRILEALNPPRPIPPGEPIRRWRAIQVLERNGSKEARGVLEVLETDSPSLRERREAKTSLERLNRGAGLPAFAPSALWRGPP